jgi:hypothetical protein
VQLPIKAPGSCRRPAGRWSRDWGATRAYSFLPSPKRVCSAMAVGPSEQARAAPEGGQGTPPVGLRPLFDARITCTAVFFSAFRLRALVRGRASVSKSSPPTRRAPKAFRRTLSPIWSGTSSRRSLGLDTVRRKPGGSSSRGPSRSSRIRGHSGSRSDPLSGAQAGDDDGRKVRKPRSATEAVAGGDGEVQVPKAAVDHQRRTFGYERMSGTPYDHCRRGP